MSAQRQEAVERERQERYQRMRTACVWVYGEAHVERVEREIKESEHPDGDDWMLQRMCLIRRQQSILREA